MVTVAIRFFLQTAERRISNTTRLRVKWGETLSVKSFRSDALAEERSSLTLPGN